MQTYSHLIITVALRRFSTGRSTARGRSTPIIPPAQTAPLLIGSVMPDVPLILLTGLCALADRMRRTTAPNREGQESYVRWLFGTGFFQTWWVKAVHNLFHGPLLVALYMVIGYMGWKANRQWGAPLFWFAGACMLHTAIDIPLHHDDGPLLLFPFDLDERFVSPVSYWDPKHYGKIFAPVEHIIVLALVIYLILKWRKSRHNPMGAATDVTGSAT